MTIERHILRPETGLPARGALSDRIEHFELSNPRHGQVEWSSARLGAVVVSSVRSTGHVISVDATQGSAVLAPIGGALAAECARAQFRVAPGETLFLDAGARTLSVEGTGGAPALGIGFAFPRPPEPIAVGVLEVVRADARAAVQALVGFGRYVMELAARDPRRFDRAGFAAAAEALILDIAAEFRAEAAAAPRARDGARRAREARDFMRTHADEPLTVEAIAAAVGLGPRALQMAFRDHFAATPRGMLAEIRLDRARARLLAADAATTVSGAALDSGIAHLGRFSVAYRARFGESPSETLRRALTGR